MWRYNFVCFFSWNQLFVYFTFIICLHLGKFTTEHSLRQHTLKSHSNHYRCSHCSTAFSLDDLQGFKYHMFKHYYNGPLKCIQCGFTCYDRSVFIHHTETGLFVHDNLCTQCNEPMEKYDLYLLHIAENHNGQLKYKCKRCSDLFDDLKNLDMHRRMVHVKKPEYFWKLKNFVIQIPNLGKNWAKIDHFWKNVKNGD